jgi:ABC-type bacteriocin/lantibiotic exporter with double-glycine peptidase domain
MTPTDRVSAPSLARHARRSELGDVVLSTLAINILSLALPVMTLQIYDRILPNPGTSTLWALLLGVGVAVVLEVTLRLCRAHLIGWNAAGFEHRATSDAFRRLLEADLARIDLRGVGEQMNRLNAIARVKDIYSGAMLTTAVDLAFVAVFLAVVAYLSSWLVLAPLAVLAVFIVHALMGGADLKSGLEHRDRMDDKRYDFLIEALEGVHTIKSFALEREFERRYEHFEKRSSVANFAVTEAAAHTFNIGMVFSHVMIVAVIVVGAVLTLDGIITSGALIATVLLSGRIMQPVQRALAIWARYQDIRLAHARARELMAVPQVETTAEPAATPRLGTVELRGAGFRTDLDGPWLFRNADLSLKPGNGVAIFGAPRSGRRVLLKVVAGVLAPTEGQALIDGVPSAVISPRERATHVGYLAGDAAIFRGTIRDNLTRFGLTPEDSAREVAALLGVDKDVARLPAGFDTRLEGNALDVIPPGLRQRIALARALAPKPRVIVFDNADKGLDREGYALVFELLARIKDKTALVILSDDENICSLAGERLLIENGRLAPLPDPRAERPLFLRTEPRR